MIANFDITLVIVLGTFLFLTLLVFIVLFIIQQKKRQAEVRSAQLFRETQFRQELLQVRLEAQDASMEMIAQELHDNICQLISSARLTLAAAIKRIEEPPQSLFIVESTLAKANTDIRLLSKSLHKEWLSQFSLIQNVQHETDRLNAAQIISAELYTEINFLSLDVTVQLMLFRVVQEALQNVIKHASATKVTTVIKVIDQHLEIHIRDNGSGMTRGDTSSSGIGMFNMRQRIKLLGGRIRWDKVESGGTIVDIQLPYKDDVL